MKQIRFILVIGISLILALPSLGQQVQEMVVTSSSMNKEILNTVITPSDYKESQENYPTIYLLHGAGGDHTQWIKLVPELRDYADLYDVIIVCPDGGFTSWYLDSPVDPSMRYETYIADELVKAIDERFRTIQNKDDRAISGLSMGGHGALYLAIRHPEIWGAAGSTSGGVDLRPFEGSWDLTQRLGTIRNYSANWEAHSVINMVDELGDNGLQLIMDCGVDDFFYQVNENLHEKLLELDISHDYSSRPGGHDATYWNNSIQYHFLFFDDYFDESEN